MPLGDRSHWLCSEPSVQRLWTADVFSALHTLFCPLMREVRTKYTFTVQCDLVQISAVLKSGCHTHCDTVTGAGAITPNTESCTQLLVQLEEIVLCAMSTQSDPQQLPYIQALSLLSQLHFLAGYCICIYSPFMAMITLMVTTTVTVMVTTFYLEPS